MSIPLTRQTTDHSGKGSFCFGFFCDRCGKEWLSRKVKFRQRGKGREDKDTKDEINRLLWAEKHRAVFEQANLEARLHFNLCPLCGKWVCDDCFCAEEVHHGGVCGTCCQ